MPVLILQQLFLEALLDIVYFPAWWYSRGLLLAMHECLTLLEHGNSRLAPGLWLRTIFVPMYGQYDWQGRIISFFMRVAQIIARSIALFFWCMACVALFVLWILFPFIVFAGIVRSFS